MKEIILPNRMARTWTGHGSIVPIALGDNRRPSGRGLAGGFVSRLGQAAALMLVALLTAGCGIGNLFGTAERRIPLELDYNRVLPDGWEPIAQWYEVNIDGDGDTEYLLLFTYDAGQVGAVIYDQQVSTDLVTPIERVEPGPSGAAEDIAPTPADTSQNGVEPQTEGSDGDGMTDTPGTTGVTETPTPADPAGMPDAPAVVENRESGGISVPLQAFGFYRPYLLLPSNWDYTYGGAVSHGFVAHPQDAGNIVVSQVQRTGGINLANALGLNGPQNNGSGVQHPAAELVLQGGATHLTFVWWKNRQEGYGVTQLYAPGGFRGIDWTAWRAEPRPIDSISGLFPLVDYRARSLLCREIAYSRVGIDGAGASSMGQGMGQGAGTENGAPPLPGLSTTPADNGLFLSGNEELADMDDGRGLSGTPGSGTLGSGTPGSGQPENGGTTGGSAGTGGNNGNGATDTGAGTSLGAPTLPNRMGTQGTDGLPNVAFVAEDRGIHFCTPEIPIQPFYPEGVALAYLLRAESGATAANGGYEHLVTPGIGSGFLLEALDVRSLAEEQVNDIQSFATVPVALDAIQNGSFSPTTSVCVELARQENPAQRRRLLFTLRYHAPDMEARTPDRWTISGIVAQPEPVNGIPEGYCRTILGLQ